jgi:hypothetical protein
MLIFDRRRNSARAAKIASRTSSVMTGWPPPARTHRRSMHPAGPLSLMAAAIRFRVRSPTCPLPSRAASWVPRAFSSATLACRRCSSVVARGSNAGRGSPGAGRSGSPPRNPVSVSSTWAARSRTTSRW